jgi:hypothetical protein
MMLSERAYQKLRSVFIIDEAYVRFHKVCKHHAEAAHSKWRLILEHFVYQRRISEACDSHSESLASLISNLLAR